MSDINIIEFLVYGLIAYASMLMLIISTIRESPFTESQSLARAIFMVPGIVCAFILAGSGVNITMETVNTINLTNDTIANVQIFSEDTTTDSAYVLINPVWGAVHIMLGSIMSIYVLMQMLMLLSFWPSTKRK